MRTPVGTRKGALAEIHPADLGAHVLRELVNRTGIDPSAAEDVIMGCVVQLGPQAGDIARTAWLSAGLPQSVPGVTIDRQCRSAQQALHFAAQGVMSGTQDLVIAAGVENIASLVVVDELPARPRPRRSRCSPGGGSPRRSCGRRRRPTPSCTRPRSPVWNQPSVNAPAVASGLFQ